MAMTDIPLARRPSTGCRLLWLKASVSRTASMASTSWASVIAPCSASYAAIRDFASASSSPPSAARSVGTAFAAQSHDEMSDGLAEKGVTGRVCFLQRSQLSRASLFQLSCLGHKAVALGVEDGAHISLGDGSDRAEHALFSATSAGSVARNQRIVVGTNHKHVAQRRGLGVGRVGGVEQAQILLRRVWQQVEEGGAGFVLSIHVLRSEE